MSYFTRVSTFLVILTLIYSLTSRADGSQLTRSLPSLAPSGFAARASDASTFLLNPAGMSTLSAPTFFATFQLSYTDLLFTRNTETTVNGSRGGNPISFSPDGGLFYVYRPDGDICLGLGAVSSLSISQAYDNDWVGRYYFRGGNLVAFSIVPSIGYQALSHLSIGVGIVFTYGVFDQKAAVRNYVSPTDGELDVKDNAWGFGATVGVMFQPADGTRLSLAYHSPVKLRFKGTPHFTDLDGGTERTLEAAGATGKPLDLAVILPQSATVGAFHQICREWAILAELSWYQWSQFGKVGLAVSVPTSPTIVQTGKYQDTYHAALGGEYHFAEDCVGSLMIAYESSPVKNEDRMVDFVAGPACRCGAGLRWKAGNALELGVTYELIWSGDLSLDEYCGIWAGRVAGTYTNTSVNLLSLSLAWEV
jgi:long-chain fatty acid transport protein